MGHDLVGLGEVMLRLAAPPPQRLDQAVALDVQIGGSEANVLAAVSRLGLRTAFISALPAEHAWGDRTVRELSGHGVDCAGVLRRPGSRMGLYFLEYGAPPRPVRVLYDRRDSAMSQLVPEEVDWALVRGARMVHLSGITAALGDNLRAVVRRAFREAQSGGVPVSFDVNYRSRLWSAKEARDFLSEVLAGVRYLFIGSDDAETVFELSGEPEKKLRGLASGDVDVLEEALSSVEGLRTMTSASQEQMSRITLEFTLDREIEAAAQDVRDKVSRVRGLLPEDIEEPVVAKEDADAFPIMFLALTSKSYGLMELSDIADRELKPRLQTIPGVSGAPIFGERRFAMRVWLSPSELAARGLTAQDVEQAIRTRSVEIPAGRIESERREFSVRYLGEMRTPEEFAELTVSNSGAQLVKLGDVARVEPGPEDERSVTRYSQQPAIFVGVVRQSKANVLEVAEAVHAELPAVQRALPAGVELNMAFDGSIFVQRSIQEARETLVITAILVIVIIFLFLRTLRATIIPAVAIPVSIVATFAVLAGLGFSVNSLTLLGLILAIGIVVDDAIIVMENAYRHQEELGKDPQTAAIDGTREITTAVIATAIALVAVFSPLLFLTGARAGCSPIRRRGRGRC
jgi:sugar/nucleoside kinase (ribokinase family)/preprotein translocase subunit SecF